MNILSVVNSAKTSEDLLKILDSQVLQPLKSSLEKSLGHAITSYSVEVDLTKSEIAIIAGGKEDRKTEKMICASIKLALKMSGKKLPDFSKCMIHVDGDKKGIALQLKDDKIQTYQI